SPTLQRHVAPLGDDAPALPRAKRVTIPTALTLPKPKPSPCLRQHVGGHQERKRSIRERAPAAHRPAQSRCYPRPATGILETDRNGGAPLAHHRKAPSQPPRGRPVWRPACTRSTSHAPVAPKNRVMLTPVRRQSKRHRRAERFPAGAS